MGTSKRFAIAIAGAVVLVAAAIVAPVASSSTYPNQPNSTNFRTGPGGWKSGALFDGLCIPPLTCPAVTNVFVPSGGSSNVPPTDGHLRTRLSGLTGIASTSTGVWQSPVFTYNGDEGSVPNNVYLKITRRSDVDELLSVAGNSVDFTVEVVRANGLVVATPYDHVPLTDKAQWDVLPAVDIGNKTLGFGQKYLIRISTRFITGVDVIEDATADYDNVSLRTTPHN